MQVLFKDNKVKLKLIDNHVNGGRQTPFGRPMSIRPITCHFRPALKHDGRTIPCTSAGDNLRRDCRVEDVVVPQRVTCPLAGLLEPLRHPQRCVRTRDAVDWLDDEGGALSQMGSFRWQVVDDVGVPV